MHDFSNNFLGRELQQLAHRLKPKKKGDLARGEGQVSYQKKKNKEWKEDTYNFKCLYYQDNLQNS